MFTDVALMVAQQGDQIDSLADYVEATAVHTGAAATTMQRAVVTRRRTQKQKWILIAVLVAIVVAIAVALGVSLGTK